MKMIFKSLSLFFFCLTFLTNAAEALEAAGSPKVYEGPNGQTVTMVYLRPLEENKVLVKFEGFTNDWDNRVVMHTLEKNGKAEDFATSELTDKRYVSITGRDRWGSMNYQAYPPGTNKSVNLEYEKKESKKADAAAIINEYKNKAKK